MPENPQDIYLFGFDRLLNRGVIVKSPVVFDSFETTNPSLLTSGPLSGNLTLADGNIQSGGFVSGSVGFQFTSTGYFEANQGLFRGNLQIGSGNDVILADADDTTWRLGIGNSDISQAPFRVDKNGVAYGVGFKQYETFNTGEAITAGNVVCIKNQWASASIAIDGYVDSANPTGTFGIVENLYIGQGVGTYYVFMKPDLTNVPTNFLKAELVFHTTSAAASTLFINFCTADAATAWNEDNLSWNNMPTMSGNSNTTPAYTQNITIAASPENYYFMDITQLLRLWKNDIYPNFGLGIATDVAEDPGVSVQIASSEYTINTTFRPYVRWLARDDSDGLIYKANANDYVLSRSVIGIATETVSTLNYACQVQTLGKNSNITALIGDTYYLSTSAGGITNAVTNLTRKIKIGTGTASNELLIGIDASNLYIESVSGTIAASSTIDTLYVHPDATRALVEYDMNSGTNYGNVNRFTCDLFSTNDINIQYAIDGTNMKSIDPIWNTSTNLFTMNSGSGASGASDKLYYNIHFYT